MCVWGGGSSVGGVGGVLYSVKISGREGEVDGA